MMIHYIKKKQFILFLLIIVSSGCSIKEKNPLIGRWQSNEVETLEEIRTCGAYTEKQIELITSKISFGEFILEIDEDTITSYYEGSDNAGSYRIISIDSPFIIIESHDPITEEVGIVTIEIRDNSMWIPSTLLGFREVFTRIN
jgi:hypothetical protein